LRRSKDRSRISLRLWIGLTFGLLLTGGAFWLVRHRIRENAAKDAESNFQKVALAMIYHADDHNGAMLTHAIFDNRTGKPLLSWRVAILPKLGYQALYNQIHLAEPWDSPHNQQFWERMPKEYELPGLPASEGMTAIQVFKGPQTPFRGFIPFRYPAGFTDGTSQTALIAEAATPVNWMQPEDIDMHQVDPEDIRASLGDRTGKGPLIGLGDGSVRFLSARVKNVTLQAVITPDGGEVIAPP
jgi:hypothetical protein